MSRRTPWLLAYAFAVCLEWNGVRLRQWLEAHQPRGLGRWLAGQDR